jgi:ubiquinone/menaquinone biosynthesis C-methylase UbiE
MTGTSGSAMTNRDIEAVCEGAGPLDVTLRGALAEVPALALRVDGKIWTVLPTTPHPTWPDVHRMWSCELPPLHAPADGEIVELVDPRTMTLLDRIVLGRREPKRNGYGLAAADVYADDAAPLFSAPGMAFDGAVITVYGAHLPPMGDPSKLRADFNPGVAHVFDYPLPSPEFANHYWYWPNAGHSAFRVTIDLAASLPASDPFDFRFVYSLDDGAERNSGSVYIPSQLSAAVGFPSDVTQITRVQTFDSPQTVAFTGYNAYRSVVALLDVYGIRPRSGLSILDWGCGHGRVTRHFLQNWRGTEIWGTDIDPENIHWCKRRFSDGVFVLSPLWPPSELPAETFDAVFGISVMTHLSAPAQQAWLAELSRVLKPNGLALLTFSGEAGVAYSSAFRDPTWWKRWQEAGFDDEQVDPVLSSKISDATYYRNTHQTAANIRATWSNWFDILGIERTKFGYQDVAVMRKR